MKRMLAVLLPVFFLMATLNIHPVSTQGGCTPPGLIAWWPGEGNANDVVNSYHGTLMNGATFTSGMIGKAFSLDGNDDYVDVPGISAPMDKPYVLWIRIDSHPGVYNTLIEFGNDAPWFGVLSSGAVELFSNNPRTTLILNTGQWYHVAYTSDSATNTSKIYINGIQNDPNGSARTDTTTGMGIGWHAGDTHFDGLIDEVAIFNRALSASEIATIYAFGIAGNCSTPAKKKTIVPSLLPLASTNIAKVKTLLTEANDLLSKAQGKGADTTSCEKSINESTQLYELAKKYRNSPITANNYALQAITKLTQAIECLKALLG